LRPFPARRCYLSACLPVGVLTVISSPVFAQQNQDKNKQEQPPFPKVDTPAPPVGSAQQATPGKVDASQLPSPMTLAQAIEAALQLQPDVAVAVANRQQGEQQEKQARSRYFPTVAPQYTYLNQYNFGNVTRFISGDGGVTLPVTQAAGSTTERRQAQLNLNYDIYDNGNRDLQARQARQSLRGRKFGEASTRQTVITTVAQNYFDTLRNAALVKVSEAQVTRAQQTLDVVQAQVEVGVAARKDVYQAQADLLNARVNLIRAQNNYAVSQANLKNAIGVVGGAPLVLTDVVAPTEGTPTTATLDENKTPIPQALVPDAGTINQLSEMAYRMRPDIAQSQQNVDATKTSVSISKRQTQVQVFSTFSASNQLSTDSFDRSIGNSRTINLNASYPLFDGGLVRSQFHAAEAGARAQEAQLTGLRQQVAVEVEQAFRNLTQARASLPAALAAQQAAEINYQSAIESRREGVGSIVDVLTAQTLLVQAQQSYVQAVYDFYTADAQLARAVGQADRIAQASGASVTPPTTGTVQPAPGQTTPATPTTTPQPATPPQPVPPKQP
jgi:outer membrane protein